MSKGSETEETRPEKGSGGREAGNMERKKGWKGTGKTGIREMDADGSLLSYPGW